MITFDNIWLWQKERPILMGISFTIKAHERVAILGPSGAGKTTILKLILGLSIPDTGQVLIDGVNICTLKDNELNKMRLRFSIVFQEGALFDSLTVQDNVAFYFKEHTNLSHRQIKQDVSKLLKRVDLEQAAQLMPEQLSGGMKRRVAIARSLAVIGAQMRLYDEPTSGLDPINAGIIRDLISNLAVNGTGFIVVTHEIFDALALASRFMFLKDGRIVFDGNREEFLHSRVLQLQEFLKPYQYILDKL